MIYEDFSSYNIRDAADEILRSYLRNFEPFYRGGKNIFYFHGWEGLGASAVLTAIAESARSERSSFDIVIHVDCSVWKSRRDMHRIIAKELKLNRSAMALFDKQDEDDDFSGLAEHVRAEILDVAELIFRTVEGRKCLMILHTGSDYDIDLTASGVPVFDWRCKVLWTFGGRFRLDPKIIRRVENAQVFLCASPSYGFWYSLANPFLLNLVRDEAAQVCHDVDPTVITDCWFYLSFLHYKHDNSIDYDREIHASNYWVCDGIIPGNIAWEIGEKLQEELRLNYLPTKEDHGKWFGQFSDLQEKKSRWISTTSKSGEIENIRSIPNETTSYILTLEISDHPATLPKHLFEQSSKLRILILSWCSFSFASPPFICCNNLRFISIRNCRDDDVELIGKGDDKQDTKWAFLQRLWVLDIRGTHWDWILSPSKMLLMIELREVILIDAGAGKSDWCMAKLDLTWLCELRRLRVISSYTFLTALVEDSFLGMQKLELLDLSGNGGMEVLPNLSAASGLKVLVLDGCEGLHHVELDCVSASLESFSFDGSGRAAKLKNSVHISRTSKRAFFIPKVEVPLSSHHNQELPKVSKISLEGCSRLKNVFLWGLPNLEELNLSGTTIQALDLKAMKVKKLERLFLIGCDKLRRVQWRDAEDPPLKLLCVDTRGKAGRSMDGDCQLSHSYPQMHDFTHVVATDARFLGGLDAFGAFRNNFHLHLLSTLSSRQLPGTKQTMENSGSSEELDIVPVVGPSFPYSDVHGKVDQEYNGEDHSHQACTQLIPLERHIEFAKGDCNWESKVGHQTMVSLMNNAQSLHVHDNCSISAANLEFEESTQFTNLRWCRIERCPKINRVFFVDPYWMSQSSFKCLDTFWASDLLAAHCIWSKNLRFQTPTSITEPVAFSQLRRIYLHSCPRLTFVLPCSSPTLASLETIHITYCGELRQIFPKGKTAKQELATEIEFPKLRNILLQELPMLQQTCEGNMSVPMLETMKLRGCWSLRRLPAIHTGRAHNKPLPVVDCEKEWWDKLQWDGLEASHGLFSPRHSHYYKKTIPRGSLLR